MSIVSELAKICREHGITEIPKITKEEAAERQKKYEKMVNQKYFFKQAKEYLHKRSLLLRKSSLDDVYSDLDVNTPDSVKKLSKRSLGVLNNFANGSKYTIVMSGPAGTGKTMLTSCMLNKLNEKTELRCLFISVVALHDLIQARFSDLPREEKNVKSERLWHVMDDIKNADVVALDDLGSESSLRDDLSEASQSMQEHLFKIGEILQDKALIVSTNNTSSELLQIYNQKICSRLLTKNPDHIFNFENVEDRRLKNR